MDLSGQRVKPCSLSCSGVERGKTYPWDEGQSRLNPKALKKTIRISCSEFVDHWIPRLFRNLTLKVLNETEALAETISFITSLCNGTSHVLRPSWHCYLLWEDTKRVSSINFKKCNNKFAFTSFSQVFLWTPKINNLLCEFTGQLQAENGS